MSVSSVLRLCPIRPLPHGRGSDGLRNRDRKGAELTRFLRDTHLARRLPVYESLKSLGISLAEAFGPLVPKLGGKIPCPFES